MKNKSKFLLALLLCGTMLAGCGEQGPKGDQGAPGEKGEKGDDGLTPAVSINDQNHWVINGVDTGVTATGKDGETPTISISDDGYWIINGVKTSTLAKGTNGNNGTNGKDGVSIVKIEKQRQKDLLIHIQLHFQMKHLRHLMLLTEQMANLHMNCTVLNMTTKAH